MMDDFFDGVSDEALRAERNKARQLRKSNWWRRKTGNGRCHYCGRQVPPKELTMDHVVPLGRGGRSTKGNLVPACKECNTKKRTMLPLEWEEYMERLG